jgi:ubiquinone/menaquinone biosynthesis C-methylase UbiE
LTQAQDPNPFYARGEIAERYDCARALPPDVERDWAARIARQVPLRPGISIDLGCGTGRFTKLLATAFGARVIGVDPSPPMLRAAVHALAGVAGVSLVQGRAESIPLAPGSADLVLMSMSYHHVPDKAAALASIRRVLRLGGVLCIRTCSREALKSYLYQRFFPAALAFDEQRYPTRDGLRDEVCGAGFRSRVAETVSQRVADSLRQYRENVATRTHSDLQAISDEEFSRGMEGFDAWCAAQDGARPVFEEVDLFTFSAD